MNRLLVFGGLIVAVTLVGCSGSSNNGRLEISGQVKLKGVALDQAVIQFLSPDPKLNSNMAVAQITNGTYKVPANQGLTPGTYRVLISAGEPGTSEAGIPGDSTTVKTKERIPLEWNEKSTKTVEVKAGSPNTFNFDIP